MRYPFARAAVIALLSAGTSHAFDVTACYQTVPANETGVLQVDLVCDGSGGPNVSLSRHARLQLSGHTISGGYIGVATDPGHIGKNVIDGPGEIFGVGNGGGGPFGCAIATSGKATIRNVILRNNDRGIVSIYDFAMKLHAVSIKDNLLEGISSYFVNLGSFPGPGKGQITGRNVVITGNGDNGVEAFGLFSLRDSVIIGNGGAGIVSGGLRYTLQSVYVMANAGAGVVSTSFGRGKLKGSTATGNGPGGDVAGPIAPKLVASTCEHSVDTDSGGTLGICTGD